MNTNPPSNILEIRRADERGLTDIGWLYSRHSFSFGDYFDPSNQGFRRLRVINDDVIAGGGGFDLHPHRNMEIVTLVLEGSLRHRDSMGHESVLSAGEMQAMSAGARVVHGEWNASASVPVHLLQIWIEPSVIGGQSSYQERKSSVFAVPDRAHYDSGLILAVAPRSGSAVGADVLTIQQDVSIYVGTGRERYEVGAVDGRCWWIQMISGTLDVGGEQLRPGDAAALAQREPLSLSASDSDARFLLFDLN